MGIYGLGSFREWCVDLGGNMGKRGSYIYTFWWRASSRAIDPAAGGRPEKLPEISSFFHLSNEKKLL